MKVCGGCEAEYEEAFKFCPECGRAFGGEQAAQDAERLNAHLRGLAAAGNAELRLEQQLRSSKRAFDRPAGFELSDASRQEVEIVTEWIAGAPTDA